MDRAQVLAYRLAAQHLATRTPDLLAAAGACGVQNSPPGSAPLALHARVDGLTAEGYDDAVAEAKTLVQVWSLRASPYVVPTGDLPVFTRGLLPRDEAAMRVFLQGMTPVLDKAGVGALEAVDLVGSALEDILDGRTVTKRGMGSALAPHMPPKLRSSFDEQTFTDFTATLARAVALRAQFCMAPRETREATFVRLDQWLDGPVPAMDDDAARAELVRRYLHCYGPSTLDDYTAWTGTARHDAEQSWDLVTSELVEVAHGWLLAADEAALDDPPDARGVRFLPPHDPLLLMRDRTTLIPDTTVHKQVWKAVGNPGVMLLNGEAVGMWRPRKQGRKLTITVEPFGTLGRRDEIAAEATSLAPYRDASTAEVVLL